MTRAAELVARYGYFAIFGLLMLGIVGPLIPDETILVFAGILAREGRLDYVAVLAAGYAGSLCGITMSYVVGVRAAVPDRKDAVFSQALSQVYGRGSAMVRAIRPVDAFLRLFRRWSAALHRGSCGRQQNEGAALRDLRLHRRTDLGDLLSSAWAIFSATSGNGWGTT